MKLNGNLVLNGDASGELQNVYIERLSAAPSFDSTQKGRVYFNTASGLYFYNDGSTWSPFATGGNAAALQTEVDAIEASIGAAVNGTGTFNSTPFSGDPIIGSSTTLTGAILAISQAAYGHELLSELGDVTLASLGNGQYLKYNGTTSKWYNETLVLGDVTDVTATAAEVNTLHGSLVTTTELNYVHGVTSSIQTQLNNKQPLDAGLTALATFADGSGTGIVVQTGPGVFVDRTIVGPSSGVVVSNGSGVGGAPTISLSNNLAALEALSGTGFVVHTGAGTFIDGVALATASDTRITVSNGNGVAASPTIDLATVSNAGGGAFLKLASDAYGRITGTSAVTTSDITALVDATYVNVTGDSMSGNLNMISGATITNLPTPINGTDAANKNYVDAAVSGLSWKQAVRAASIGANLALTGLQTIDGITLVAGDRVLVKDQTNGFENGIYVVSASGWTRPSDMNTPAEFEGAAVFVQEGTLLADTGWTETLAVTTVGTSPVHFNQFTGSSVLTAGTGLAQTGNVLSVILGAGIGELPTGDVGVDLYGASTSALILTLDGSTRTTDAASQLKLLLKSAGGLVQDTNGLYIPSAGVTNTMLASAGSITLDVDSSGTGSIVLGGTLSVTGNSVQGIVTSISGSSSAPVINITANDATTASKGVASYSSASFDVAGGVVSIKAGGVSNTQLANDTIGFSGDTGGAQSIVLGGTFGITSAAAPIHTVSSAAGVAISIDAATASTVGVASFSATDFSVTSGAVSLVAKGLNSLTDVATASDAAGQTLVYSATATKFVNRPTYFLYQSGGASTTHTVTHGLGQKFCNVTVVDGTDEVVIPQSITFNSASQLTVTFTSAINCSVVVMGVNAA